MSEVMIKGPQDRINWLMVAAFRYCVERHTTQAMYGVGDVILDNLDVLHTEFIIPADEKTHGFNREVA